MVLFHFIKPQEIEAPIANTVNTITFRFQEYPPAIKIVHTIKAISGSARILF